MEGNVMEKISPVYLTEKDVSILTGFALSTFRNARFNRKLFKYHKIGRSCRYKIDDVLAYMDAHKVEF